MISVKPVVFLGLPDALYIFSSIIVTYLVLLSKSPFISRNAFIISKKGLDLNYGFAES